MLTIAYMDLESLTENQSRFVNGILSGLNGSASARQAGYNGKNLDVQASKLLRNPRIKAVIEDRLKTKFQLSKEQFTATCWQEFLDSIDKSDRARFLDLSGRALGYLKTTPDVIQNVSVLSIDELKSLHNSRATNNLQQRDTIPLSDTMPIKIIPEVDRTHTIPLQNVSDTPSNSDNVT